MVMSRNFLMAILLLAIPFVTFADDVRVSAQLDENEIAPDMPVRGTLTIQHDASQEIDSSSFSIQGAPLKVEFLKDVEIDPQSSLRVSHYRFEIESQSPGLHILPPIKVVVDGKTYATTALTYEVPTVSRMGRGPEGIVLELKAYVKAAKSLYVGQQTNVGYRIFYNENFELKDQVLPLLDPEGFKKVGSERFSDIREKGMSVRQIEQRIEAVTPGTYSIGPSYIVGYRYRTDFRGIKKAVGLDVRADAPAVELIVKDFPKEGKPASFNGAVGQEIDFNVELLSRPEVTAGDKISLSLRFTSSNDLSGIKLPELCCQPGFPGFFELGDIPPAPSSSPGSIIYFVEMRPLTDKIKQLPPIEFAYFDPNKESYVVRRSEGIPLKVSAAPDKVLPIAPDMPRLPDEKKVEEPSRMKTSDWPKEKPQLKAIEIETIYPLAVNDVADRYFGTWAVILVIPIGFLILYIQMDIIRRRKKMEATSRVKGSVDIFEEAKKLEEGAPEFYVLLEQAFLMALVEGHQLAETPASWHALPAEGVPGEVRAFLAEVEEARYSRRGGMSRQEMIEKADQLFYNIVDMG